MIFEIDDSNNIEIWCEDRGRKCDTFVHGWNISNDELKEHLKIIKKKKGCNGSIKEIIKDTGKIKVLQLQGNNIDFINNYLLQNNIKKESIKIKI